MAQLILGPMLRHVTETSATIWVETDERCTVTILDRSAPTFCVAGHHYALVIIEGLAPASCVEYDVRLDGAMCWPAAGSRLPTSRVRTLGGTGSCRIVFGSCRTAAPHEPPWALELVLDPRGRGVDALYAFALAMASQPADEWPTLAVFLGDQIYADDSSPDARARITERRSRPDGAVEGLPDELVGGFEEYTWLYQESWSPEMERWFFSNVPSVMIFDDHEMIDDWNISASWVREIREKSWWQDHVIGGLMTYWLYQHLGNLGPDTIREEGMLAALNGVSDGEQVLRAWAMKSEEFTPVPGGYRFSYVRDVGRVRLVMLDARNGRVLEPGRRQIVDDAEWRSVVEACHADVDHLLIGSSLPVFVTGGLHDLQVWNEAICDGAWGRVGRKVGEWIRRGTDMEDWSAFVRSFEAFVDLLEDVGGAGRANAPATISVLSGDIHFSYLAEIRFPTDRAVASRIHQLVSSPIRNALKPQERTVMRLATSQFARRVARVLRHAAHRDRARVKWRLDRGPLFGNALSEVTFTGRSAQLKVLCTRPHEEGSHPVLDRPIEVDLVAGSGTGQRQSVSSRRRVKVSRQNTP
ncbi:MAG: alkaline phosphatase D family protein [Actinomycetota bacterium]|nr:alkaline phosphatase D family protein [Actinomycetota bacterium]